MDVQNTTNVKLIDDVDAAYGVFNGYVFSQHQFSAFLVRHGIPWPRSPNGDLKLDDDTFRERAKVDQRIAALRELRVALSQVRGHSVVVDPDGYRPFAWSSSDPTNAFSSNPIACRGALSQGGLLLAMYSSVACGRVIDPSLIKSALLSAFLADSSASYVPEKKLWIVSRALARRASRSTLAVCWVSRTL
jgi:hypothetical protein